MDDIIKLFTKNHGIYNTVLKFRTIVFFIIVLILITKTEIINKSTFLLVCIVFSLYLSNLYVNINNDDLNDNNKLIYFKLQSLQTKTNDYLHYKINQNQTNKISKKQFDFIYESNKLDSFYIDSNLIVFLYSIIKISEYNQFEFYLLLKGTNNILKLKNEIEKYYDSNQNYPKNINEMLQTSISLKTNCINNLQNFIYSIPKTGIMYKYLDNIILEYTILITRNIKIMHKYHLDYIKLNGVNNTTLFIDINSTKGYDGLSNHSIIPGKKQNLHKLIELYV